MRRLAMYAGAAVLGAVLFAAAHSWATAWRGYEALGGEIFLLLLPLWAWMAELAVRSGR